MGGDNRDAIAALCDCLLTPSTLSGVASHLLVVLVTCSIKAVLLVQLALDIILEVGHGL